MSDQGETTIGTVARSIEMLRYFAEHNDTSIKSLSENLGLAPSTCHRLLDLLMREGIVEQDKATRRYRIGPEFFRIAFLVHSHSNVRDIARPHLQRIVERCDETAVLCLYIRATRKLIFAERVDSSHLLRYQLPMNVPMSVLWGASGRSVLAFLPEEEVEAIYASEGAAPASGDPLPDLATLKASLSEIRRRGYATSSGEKIAGAVGVNAPLFGADGKVIGSIGVTVPATRISPEEAVGLAPMICQVAVELSLSLGARRSVLEAQCPALFPELT